MNTLQILSFVGFTLLVAVITWWKLRKADTGSQQGYFLAGRSLKAPVIAASLMLTNLSTEQLVGLTGQAYRSGMSVMAWEVISAIPLIFLALIFLPRYLQRGIATIPDFIEERYDKTTRIIIDCCFLIATGICFLPIILYSGALAFNSMFHVTETFGISQHTAIWLMAVVLGFCGILYAVVGGMPDAVQTFVDSKQMDEVLRIQRDIVRSYEDDMVKYAEKKDKSRIKECFQSIPRQLAKENKKFQYSVVRKGSTAAKYAGSLQWIEDAGIISRCYNLSITELPLDGNAEEDTFKVYMRDMGLFVSMLEDGTQYDILQGNLFGYKGAIFENLIADIFAKMGRKLYYFHKDSGLEVDFVIRYKGECTLVEVKAATGNIKSTKTILNHPEKYHVSSAIKLGDYNVGRTGQVLTLPLYMAFLLRTL